ncbi:hypothetical protein CsSME_00053308 [Camellia sinensis var. sinensis]
MEQGGWIPVMKQRRGKGTGSKEPRTELFTVFVDSLPSSMDPKTLFKLFTKFGIVKDVFIPQKRRKFTNTRFGFVRFDCSVAARVAVSKANGLWVEDREIQVKMAEYDRLKEGAQNRNQTTGNKGINEAGGREVHHQHGLQRSYAEILKTNVRGAAGKVEGTIMVDEAGHGWLHESVILRFKEEYSIHGIEKIFKEKGIEEVMVRRGGGRDVVVTFKSKEAKDAKLSLVREWCGEWCEFVKEWEPGARAEQERCLWLRCHGIPLSMWNRNTLCKIGNIWGSVIRLEGDICQPKSFCYGRVRIVTQCMDFINKTINLECKGRLYPVMVCEEQPVSMFDNDSSILSVVEDVHSSNGTVNHEPIAGCGAGNEADDMPKEVEEEDDELAYSDTVVVETQCGLEPNCKAVQVNTVVVEPECGVGNILGVEARMDRSLLVMADSALQRNIVNFDEHLFTPGFIKSVSGASGHRPGIHLEVNLGQIHGPAAPNGLTEEGVGTSIVHTNKAHWAGTRKDGLWVHSSQTTINGSSNAVKKARRKGKMKVGGPGAAKPNTEEVGYKRLARLYGQKGNPSSRSIPKCAVFRAAAAAVSLSAATTSGSSKGRHFLSEAQATLQLGKVLGIHYNGKDSEVLEKLVELESIDRGRRKGRETA